MANMSSAHIERRVEDARKCLVSAAIRNLRCEDACTSAVVSAGMGAGAATAVGAMNTLRLEKMIEKYPVITPSMKEESKRILMKIEEANRIFDPAKPGYVRPPPSDACPYPDTRYLHIGEPAAYEPFRCYDRVVGFN